jgi:antitoxin FitA
MPTIQIRGVPEDVHRILRRRAAEAGMSLQEFMLAELVEGARAAKPAEVVAEVDQEIARGSGSGFSPVPSAEFVRADRDRR